MLFGICNHFVIKVNYLKFQGIDSLEDVGCFGLTELGYGNNAVQMGTTAIYDKETKEFVVNTPTPLAQKYWITNGACHAHHIVVFSQLYIDGVNQGTTCHCSIVLKLISLDRSVYVSDIFFVLQLSNLCIAKDQFEPAIST